MGILDDAIREHLDLKRRRGATDSELQRLEDEAFGPPSRPGEPDFPEQEGESAAQSGNGVAREGAVAEAPVEAPIPPPAEGEQVEQPDERDEQDAAEEETAIYDEAASEPPIETLDTVEHELPEQEAEPEAPPPEGPGPEPAEEPEPAEQEPGPAAEGDETSEEDESQPEEDVLADTPDFLRDAPEDDELWFEQGKPKDFDF
ncbi:MAG: hypothetical protein AABM42_03120 [Actinomycetota bacterium]